MPSEVGTQTIFGTFGYHQEVLKKMDNGVQVGNQFVIRPFTVKQVILFALENGWVATQRQQVNQLILVD